MQRILGIDPGSRITGFGIIESDGVRSGHLHSGCIHTEDGDFPARLGRIFREITALVGEYRPDEVAVEQVFVARNAGSALKLGQARGAAICALVDAGAPVFEYSPRSVKQAVVGSGGAGKQQVQHMVGIILGLSGKLSSDQADALAVAICHAHTRGLRGTDAVAGGRGWSR